MHMLPFIHIFSKSIPMYGLCIATGLVVASVCARILTQKEHKPFEDFILYAVILFATGMFGAKLFFLFIQFPISEIPRQLFYAVTNKENSASGFVFYGGIVFSIFGFIIARAITKKPILDYLPIFSCVMPIMHGFGRLGCLCAGCCYGIPYDGFCALHYHAPISAVQRDIGIFPIQLLEAILLFILGAILIIGRQKKKPIFNNDVLILFAYLIPYAIIRFFLEFLRGDRERGTILIFSTSQFISIMVVIVSVIFIIFAQSKNIYKEKKIA